MTKPEQQQWELPPGIKPRSVLCEIILLEYSHQNDIWIISAVQILISWCRNFAFLFLKIIIIYYSLQRRWTTAALFVSGELSGDTATEDWGLVIRNYISDVAYISEPIILGICFGIFCFGFQTALSTQFNKIAWLIRYSKLCHISRKSSFKIRQVLKKFLSPVILTPLFLSNSFYLS
jgi:hypothetical protein